MAKNQEKGNPVVEVKENTKKISEKELNKLNKEQYVNKNVVEQKEDVINYYDRTKKRLLTTYKNGVIKSRLLEVKKKGKKIF